ncbi:MAG: phosphodiester glycosidase family protein [Candidatus Pelethousia sp.]|nr:phosphodiester glycosidase family protein [Candidatus Pelethousia sp.]
MGRRRFKNATLLVITGFLALVVFAVAYADLLLSRIYREQQKNLLLSAHSTPVPVLRATPSPSPTPTPTPAPTRAPLAGDIANVHFPDHDTGVDADYSYQSDELRIAVTKVEEEGVTYYVADIWMRNINCFRTAFSSGKFQGKRQSAETIAKNNDAILAVNGDFLSGLVIRNGILYRQANLRPTPTPDPLTGYIPLPEGTPRPERSTCVLYFDGRMVTEEFDTFRTKAAMKNGPWQGWQFGPTLVRGGKAAGDVNAQGRNPRCIVGYYEPGHYCLVMIDGRKKGYSIGMNFDEMIDLSLRLGLTEAYNFDGGGSAIMAFNGEIINRPSGKGEARNLLDMVVIGEYLAPDQLFAPTPSPTRKPTASPEGNIS